MMRSLLLIFGLSHLCWSQLISYTEDEVDGGAEIFVSPGTSIDGGITPSGDEDRFAFNLDLNAKHAVLVASLTYTHSSNFLAPRSHLRGEILTTFQGGATTVEISRGFLTTPILFFGGSNIITLRVPVAEMFGDKPDFLSLKDHAIRIFVDSGTNPAYVLTLKLEFDEDRFDDGQSNNDSSSASPLSDLTPSGIAFGDEQFSFHQPEDVDWFEFTPRVSGNYQVRADRSTTSVGYGRPVVEVFNALGQRLANGIAAADRSTSSLAIFSAMAGQTYRVQVLPEAGEIYDYHLTAALITFEEPATPSGSSTEDPNAILFSAPIPVEGLTFTGLSIYDSRDIDRIVFENVERVKYLVLVESENAWSPRGIIGGSSFGNPLGSLNPRFFQSTPFGSELIFTLGADFEEELGFYSIFVRPFNEFDEWRVGQSNSRFLENDLINGLSALVYFALDIDPWSGTTEFFGVANSGGNISIVLPLPPEGTNSDILLQQSSDLENWEPIPPEFLNRPSALIPKGTNGSVTALYPGETPALFVRLIIPTANQ